MELTHIDQSGNIHMVDVSHKNKQKRIAKASGRITLEPSTINLIKANDIAKGNVITTAQIAGIQAAKKTYELIPLCHNISLSSVQIDMEYTDTGISAVATAVSIDSTGVEMEAITAASVALITVYDMCKAVDKSMVISDVKLLSKEKIDV